MQANLQTGQWLDYHAAKLAVVTAALEEQLQKYIIYRYIYPCRYTSLSLSIYIYVYMYAVANYDAGFNYI